MSCYVAEVGLELILFLPQSPKLWDCWDSAMCHHTLKGLAVLVLETEPRTSRSR